MLNNSHPLHFTYSLELHIYQNMVLKYSLTEFLVISNERGIHF